MQQISVIILTTVLAFIVTKACQWTWDKLIPKNSNKKEGKKYGKK